MTQLDSKIKQALRESVDKMFNEAMGSAEPSPRIQKNDYFYSQHYNNEAIERGMGKIRITESALHDIIKESVKRVLNEIDGTELNQFGYGARELRNMLGDFDESELNAACDAEECEDIADDIVKDLCQQYGYYRLYDKGSVFDFDYLKQMLADKYDMKYLGCFEDDEAVVFGNRNFQFILYPINFYPQGIAKFRVKNFDVIPTSYGWYK